MLRTEPRKEVLADGIEIWLGDCRDVLPLIGRVDAVVTDPPYGLGDWNNRGTNKKRPFDSDFTQQWDIGISENDVRNLLSVGRHQILWGANYFLDALPRTKQMFIWNKGIRGMHFNDCEIAWCSQWREASRVFDFSPSAQEPKEHQTQKPLALMVWCVNRLPLDAEIICDPFMGSGTTGVACVNLSRKFIGIEREPKYYDIARRRISEALSRPRLPFEEPPQVKQEVLF